MESIIKLYKSWITLPPDKSLSNVSRNINGILTTAILLVSTILRALSICQNWPAGPVRKQMKLAISTGFLPKNVLLHACYLGFDWSGRKVVIKSEIIISTGMIWPVISDKWKAPLDSD